MMKMVTKTFNYISKNNSQENKINRMHWCFLFFFLCAQLASAEKPIVFNLHRHSVSVAMMPTAIPDNYSTTINTTISRTAADPDDLLDNDSAVPNVQSFGGGSLGGTMNDHPAGTTATVGGHSVTVNADGSFIYIPQVGFIGNFTFYYYSSSNGPASALVTIQVQNVCPPANIIYVNDDASGANNGTSWDDAFTDLQDALNSTCPGITEIWVAAGTYTPGINQSDAFVMKNDLAIYGGFAGNEPPGYDLSLRDFATYTSTLSGEIGVAGPGDNCTYVINNISNIINATAVLDGFTVRDAVEDGVLVDQSSPTIANCVFTENGVDGIDGGASQITNCAFINNGEYGISQAGSSTTFTNCKFFGNGSHGAAFSNGSSPTLVNCSFSGNNIGGLVAAISSTPTVKNSILWGNVGSSFLFLGSGADITNSIVQGGCPTGGFPITCTNVLDVDPLFVDQANGDLHLQECSPAIDAGDDNDNNEQLDLDGNTRKFEAIAGGSLIDLGAYEYQTTYDICTACLTSGNIVYVNDDAGGNNDGKTWTDAFNDLQDALAVAGACPNVTEIWVAAGTYKPTSGTDRNISFVMKNGVSIYGGLAGNEPSNYDLDLRDFAANTSTLSGEIGAAGIGDNTYTVVFNDFGQSGSPTRLDGFTVTGGNSSVTSGSFEINNNGGGIYNRSSYLTVANCILTGNSAYHTGGGMINLSGTPSVVNCEFSNNTAGSGAGLYNLSSNAVITDCIFSDNNSTNFSGGGMANKGSSPTVTNCLFSGNTASSVGGGMYNTDPSSPVITNCTFSGNTAPNGGGVYIVNTSPVIKNSIIWGNSTVMFVHPTASPTVANTIVQGGFTPCTNCPNTNGNIDPLFVSTTDLHLTGCSPAIDAGDDNANNEPTDLDGNTRKFEAIAGGSLIDLGAYEFQSVVNFTTYYTDADGDNFGTGPGQDFCADPGAGWVLVAGDCDDGDMDINPNATEVCDGVDNDCDTEIDEGGICCPAGNILYVNDDAAGANDGSSWADAFNDLQEALAKADMCPNITEIWVAEGTYKPTSGTERNISFQMKNNLAILGGFPDMGNPDLNDRDWKVFETILSGDIGVPGVVTDNSYSVVVSNAGIDASGVIDGFTVTGAEGEVFSGGLLAVNSSPTILNCLFKNNSSDYMGGGVMCFVASPTITNCIFLENHSMSFGGGIANAFVGSPNINKCVFTGNTAGNFGGGIYSQDNTNPISISNCAFYENSSNNWGGGISIQSGNDININNCIFDGNTAGNGIGGGVYSQIFNNSLTLFNCTFLNNTSEAIRSLSAATISNIIVWGNGAGIFNASQPINNCIVEGGYSPCVNCPNGNGDVDPLFVGGNDYHLTECSPAIDAGTNIGAPADDLDGNARPFNATGVNNVDIGAYEFQGTFDVCTACLTSGNVIYVNDDAAGKNNGKSWADAFNDLQDALAVANTCPNVTEIWVAAGTYTPGTNRTDAFVMKNNLAIYGGFPNTGNPGFGDRDPDPASNGTVLSGEIGAAGIADNSHTVVIGSNTDNTAVLDGFTISGGNADGDPNLQSPETRGGGMYNNNGSPTISNCIFMDNTALYGAGMHNISASPIISNCSFIGNHQTFSGFGGGGIMNDSNSNPVISQCSFEDNTAASGAGLWFLGSTDLNISDCTFTNNQATGTQGYGGGIYFNTTNATLINCTFIQNTGRYGGGTFSDANGNLTFQNCNIEMNTVTAFGGGCYGQPTSHLSFINCSVSNNSALNTGSFGGGIMSFGDLTIQNCQINGNMADNAGGVFLGYGVLEMMNTVVRNNTTVFQGSGINVQESPGSTITNCLVVENISQNTNGAIVNVSSSGASSLLTLINSTVANNNSVAPYAAMLSLGDNSTTNLKNTIVANNTGGNFYADEGSTISDFVSLGNNLDSDGSSNFTNGVNGDIVGFDPLFVGGNDYHLAECSPAIDAGTATGAPADDLDGNARPVDAAPNRAGDYDMGAYEFQGTTPDPTPVCTANLSVPLNGNSVMVMAEEVGNASTGCGDLTLLINDQTSLIFDCNDVGNQIVTLKVTDIFLNIATTTCSITITDNENPVAICPVTIPDVELDINGNGTLPANVGDGSSTDNCAVMETSPSANFTCADVGVQMVTLTASDGTNNSIISCSFNVVDNTAPSANCPAIIPDVVLDANGNGTLPANIGDGSSSDNCGNVTETSPAANFTCADIGVQMVVLTASDGVNSSTASCSFNVVDNANPVAICPANIPDVVLDANGNGTLPANIGDGSSTDNCGNVTETSPAANFTCADVGPKTIVLTATDGGGLTDTETCTFSVVDNTPPSANCTTTTINATLDANGNYNVNPNEINDGSSDACGGLAFSASPSLLTCQNEGPNTVTLTVTDINGNSSNCTAMVEVSPFIANVNISHTNETCTGAGNGSITISANSGGGQVGYSIDGGINFQFSGNFNNLSPDTYTVVIKVFGIPNICEKTETVTIEAGGATAIWYKDFDNDGYSDGTTQIGCSQPNGYKLQADLAGPEIDCNDNNPLLFPGQVWYKDSDNDGYSNGTTQISCTKPSGYKAASELIQTSGDCNDTKASIHPNATEVCNGTDDNCNGEVDEGLSGETYVGNVNFTSQAQLDAWPECYGIIQGNVTIQGSTINNLGPLSNITSITGNLMIMINTTLTSLNGLENLASVGGAFYMYYNFQLSDCCAIDDLLTNGGIAGPIVIFYNNGASHCNSAAAIMAACPVMPLVGNPNNTTIATGEAVTLQGGKKMDIYPNPAGQEVNVLFNRTAPTATLRIMDMLGRVVYEMEMEEGIERVMIDLNGGPFDNGLYLVSLYENGVMTTRQLVVQK